MSKEWTTIRTNVVKSRTNNKSSANTNNILRNTKKMSNIDDLEKEGADLYNKKTTEEDNLLFAYENKILKSRSAIKRASQIKKKREAAAAKKMKNKESKTTE